MYTAKETRYNTMRYFRCGKSGLKLPGVSLGFWHNFGDTGNIGGIVLGVFVLRIIFVALNMLGINPNLQYIIKGAIILAACSLDMRKYLVRK